MRDPWDRDRVGETIRDDLPQERRQHLDEQTARGLPVDEGPGRSKMEMLRRMARMVRRQRRNVERVDPRLRKRRKER